MLVAAVVIGLVGLAFPIALVLGAVLVDAVVVLWALTRISRDRLSPLAARVRGIRWASPIPRPLAP